MNCESIRAIAGLTKVMVAHQHLGFTMVMASSSANEIARVLVCSGMAQLRVSRMGGAPLAPRIHHSRPFSLERIPSRNHKYSTMTECNNGNYVIVCTDDESYANVCARNRKHAKVRLVSDATCDLCSRIRNWLPCYLGRSTLLVKAPEQPYR